MGAAASDDVTRILRAWRDGDSSAADELAPLVYPELKRLAGALLRRERPEHTLQPTALVHEAYLRLARISELDWQSRAHFYSVAARTMRRILVDYARRRISRATPRGNAADLLDVDAIPVESQSTDLVALDAALDRLAEVDSRKSQVVEFRFFGGLTHAESAAVLKVSEKTIKRDWQIAKLWLHRELTIK